EGIDPEAANAMIKNLVNLSNNTQQLAPSFLLESTKIEYENRLIIHIFVPASSQVHRCRGKVYDRSADGDFELKSDEQIKQLYVRKNALYTENTVYPYLYETDFVPGLVERVRRIIKINRIYMGNLDRITSNHSRRILILLKYLPKWDVRRNWVPDCGMCISIQKNILVMVMLSF
ncbi:MAG: hypothetical protein PHQ11_14950, partial [Paludibacter sp.]|nr:hypothetical protein [Paludibacter sp.]